VFFSAIFIMIPAFAGKGLSHLFRGSFPIMEGIVRLALFIGYLLLVGQMKGHPARVPVPRRRSTRRSPRTRTASR
jgi:uncharacterized protein YqhQ